MTKDSLLEDLGSAFTLYSQTVSLLMAQPEPAEVPSVPTEHLLCFILALLEPLFLLLLLYVPFQRLFSHHKQALFGFIKFMVV